MSFIQAVILGIIQGLTEFIPVSSSGHLLIAHYFMGTVANSLSFDVALHIGTLFALVLYFSKDIWELILGLLGKNDKQRLAWLLAAATVPAVISGVLLESAAESSFRSVRLVSLDLILVAGIMLGAEWYYKKQQQHTALNDVTPKQGLAMGFAQAVAVVPGISRSGSTITTGLFMGLDRVAATRFSFLLGIPITAGAILKVLLSHEGLTSISHESGLFIVGIVTAFVTGLFAIRFLLRYLAKHTLAAFAYYRIAVGIIVLMIATLR